MIIINCILIGTSLKLHIVEGVGKPVTLHSSRASV